MNRTIINDKETARQKAIDYHINKLTKKHCEQVKTWIKNNVPLRCRKPLIIGV